MLVRSLLGLVLLAQTLHEPPSPTEIRAILDTPLSGDKTKIINNFNQVRQSLPPVDADLLALAYTRGSHQAGSQDFRVLMNGKTPRELIAPLLAGISGACQTKCALPPGLYYYESTCNPPDHGLIQVVSSGGPQGVSLRRRFGNDQHLAAPESGWYVVHTWTEMIPAVLPTPPHTVGRVLFQLVDGAIQGRIISPSTPEYCSARVTRVEASSVLP